ncbi:MAG: alpha/beta hydrolase, partial [archaeon]|nr:alpha/beta hydrolase [archaeon]
ALVGGWSTHLDLDAIDLIKEKVEIPMADGWSMVGMLFKRPDLKNEKRPSILIHHGLSGNKEGNYHFGIPLAMAGYNVLLVDARGHGESKAKLKGSRKDDWYNTNEAGIWPDLIKIIDYMVSRSDIHQDKITMIGHSMGAELALSQGIIDDRIKLIIALSSYFSWGHIAAVKPKFLSDRWLTKNFLRTAVKFSKLRPLNEKISPQFYYDKVSKEDRIAKVRMVHGIDDAFLPFEECFERNQEVLQLPPENYLILKKGGHFFRGQETILTYQIIKWVNEKFENS